MKKFYAIVLGLALVLALSGIASAAAQNLTVNGKITISGAYDLGASAWSWDIANGASFADITFAGAFGDKATANLVVSFVNFYEDLDDDDTMDLGEDMGFGINMKSADYTYKFGDAFSLAFMYNVDGITAYDAPILTDIAAGSQVVKGALTFEGGSAAFYTNLDLTGTLNLEAAASFAAGPATIGAGFGYDGAATSFGANVVFKASEAISVTADLFYATEVAFGVKAAYTSDSLTGDVTFKYAPAMSVSANVGYVTGGLTLAAGLGYDIDGAAISGYKFIAKYVVSETLNVWFALDNLDYAGDDYDEGISLGVNIVIDTVNTLKLKYVNDTQVVSATLEVAF